MQTSALHIICAERPVEKLFRQGWKKESEEANGADDRAAYVFVESACENGLLHGKILTQRSTFNLYIQLSVAHKNLSRVSRDCFAGHLRPRLHYAIFLKRRLQAFQPQVLLQERREWFGSVASHLISPFST